MELPRDPNILVSYVNTKLRDQYASLTELCEDVDVSKLALQETLFDIGYVYNKEENQFKMV